MKRKYYIGFAIVMAVCSLFMLSGCFGDLLEDIMRGAKRIPAEPGEFEENAKKSGFTVTEADPSSVPVLIGAQALQKAEKDGCALYFAIYEPEFFIDTQDKGTKNLDESMSGRVRANYVARIDGNRSANSRTNWNMPGFSSIAKSGDGKYFFVSSNSNTVMYLDGKEACKAIVQPIKETLNY